MQQHRGLPAVVLSAVVLALGLAGCGGSDEPDPGAGGAAQTQTGTTTTGGGSGTGDDARTAQLFDQTCGSCHTFAAADSTGGQGPNLDEIDADLAEVRRTIEQGGSGMPAFGEQLDEQQIEALAAYVVDERG